MSWEERPLSDVERVQVKLYREFMDRHFPGWEKLFKALYELGMVPGWRAIERVHFFKEKG